MKRKNKEPFQAARLNQKQLAPYFFILPVFIVLLALVVYPLVYGIVISFFNTDLAKKWDFVGLKNFLTIFTQDKFQGSILTTLKFTVFVVLGHFILGTIFGLVLNQSKPGIKIFRTILVLPWLFPDVVIALIFKWIVNPLYGLLNNTLINMGIIDKQISWLGDKKWAFAIVVLVCIWKGYPLVMVNVLAALQTVSEDVIEAAKVDGASPWQLFFRVILPSIRPVLATTVILDVVWWFKHYTIVQLLTAGGPSNVTNVVSIGIYKEAFQYFKFGKASAMAVVVFIICYFISKFFNRMLKDD
ncbi:MAG: sugar ABC transporter permease [Lachnospiraceae bacterium]|nr:sugar ABC transporter permease [Lachnospiraceae bacterium]MCI7092810.1 sugar ABC transporter permease [Lachnospiraceae bacterium]